MLGAIKACICIFIFKPLEIYGKLERFEAKHTVTFFAFTPRVTPIPRRTLRVLAESTILWLWPAASASYTIRTLRVLSAFCGR